MAVEFVKKGWGYELIIVNTPMYCGKLLHIEKDKRASLHYHNVKHETFYVHSGSIQVEMGENLTSCHLGPGDSLTIPPHTLHRMTGLESSDVYEFSTQDFADDSHRVERGD